MISSAGNGRPGDPADSGDNEHLKDLVFYTKKC
jgi:hypothetical protein